MSGLSTPVQNGALLGSSQATDLESWELTEWCAKLLAFDF